MRLSSCLWPVELTLLSFALCSSALSPPYTQYSEQQPLLKHSLAYDNLRRFELRHVFHRGSSKFPDLHRRLDVSPSTRLLRVGSTPPAEENPPIYLAASRPTSIQRLKDRRPEALLYHVDSHPTDASDWIFDDIEEPNVTDKKTVLSFARMANDAYYLEPGQGDWLDVGAGFNSTDDFGWEADGLRGHVFADLTNKTVVIAMKGTSLPFVDEAGSITNDKINDNLLFSCCCGQGGSVLLHQVCECQAEDHRGNATCLAYEIREKTRYYHLALELYHNITALYPASDIWLTGHSLGGSVASLVGLTVGQPVVTFEAPADAMAALRLGLPTPPAYRLGKNESHETSPDLRPHHPTYHFGHTADDIYMGKCNAWNSICLLAGYAMESKCHTGAICMYDTVQDKGFSPNARVNHGIAFVISDVIEAYEDPAKCQPQTSCRDCEDWTFFHDGGGH